MHVSIEQKNQAPKQLEQPHITKLNQLNNACTKAYYNENNVKHKTWLRFFFAQDSHERTGPNNTNFFVIFAVLMVVFLFVYYIVLPHFGYILSSVIA